MRDQECTFSRKIITPHPPLLKIFFLGLVFYGFIRSIQEKNNFPVKSMKKTYILLSNFSLPSPHHKK